MHKKLKLSTKSLILMIIVIILIIIAIVYLCVPGELIKTYGTLTLAIVTVFAVFYQSIVKYFNRPRFDVELASNGGEIRLKITNSGSSTAHSCRVAIEVYNDEDNDKEMIMPLFLPWDIQNDKIKIQDYSEFSKRPKEKSAPVTYDGIVLYSREYEFVKLFFLRSCSLCLYGSPYLEGAGIEPPLKTCNTSGKNNLEYSKKYKIKMTVFCEEVSQRCLKIVYFKVENDKTLIYGFDEKKDQKWSYCLPS